MSEHKQLSVVEQYIASAPAAAQPMLREIRALIRAAAPNAIEAISYGMPTYKGRSNLVHFAANKAHLGFYPTPSAIVHFQAELSGYKTSKGAIQFPYASPLPKELIAKIVTFRVEEDKAHKL